MSQCPPQKDPDDALSESGNVPEISETSAMLHRLGTPLTIINGYVQLLRRRNRYKEGDDAAALEKSLQAMEGAIKKMTEIVEEHGRGDRDDDAGDSTGRESGLSNRIDDGIR